MSQSQRGGWWGYRGLIGLVVTVAGAIVVILVLQAPVSRVVARSGIALGDEGSAPQEIRVRCGVIGTSGDSIWGGAAGAVCEDAALSRLLRAGGAAVIAGTAALFLATRRRGLGPAGKPVERLLRVDRAVGSLLLAFGLSAAGIGLAMQLATEDVTRLSADDVALADALSGMNVLAGFEVVGLGSTEGGRYEEELWLVLETESDGGDDTGAIRSAFAGIGWDLGEAPARSNDGWVDYRGLAGDDAVDQAEVGLVANALGPETDVSSNARRMLEEELTGTTGGVAVHVVPSRLAGE